LNRDFNKVVKEIDDMLLFREVDQLLKKHEKKTNENIKTQSKKKLEDKKQNKIIKPPDSKVEIFELPTKRIIKTIRVSC
jgi:hypothetical protein